jgi:arylsulfatase A-like enzyme
MRYGALRLMIGLVIRLAWVAVASAAPPNLIVILSDDQGRGDYGAFGTPDIRTPALDRLLHEGMDLRNFRANCPVCSPTRAALLTGCYPDRVGSPASSGRTPRTRGASCRRGRSCSRRC